MNWLTRDEIGRPVFEVRLPLQSLKPIEARRFWRLVDTGSDAECWIWKGSINPIHNNGQFSLRGQTETVKRVAFEIAHGIFPRDHKIYTSCRRRLCVNPLHMALGAINGTGYAIGDHSR